MAAGIETRHTRSCRQRHGGRCNCSPTYQAHVWSATEGKRLRKTFSTLSGAKQWRQEAQVALRQGTLRAPSQGTLNEVVEAWIVGAKTGAIHTRSGDAYKPSAIRGYERSLRLRVLPDFGAKRLSELRRGDLQDLVDRLVAEGHSPSTVQMSLIPLKAICRREMARGRLPVNPTVGLELPAVRGGRDRIADPQEAELLLAALDPDDRVIWASAMYAGLRRGELKALRVEKVDLAAGLIHVERGWDDIEGEISTKGRGTRRVPIASVLREHLLPYLLRSGRRDGDLIFGETAEAPFNPTALSARADTAWADLKRITLHECRHTFASLMIAAGVNAKALSTYMGHANIAITMDRYGHLMPGNEEEAAGLLDAYLERATEDAARAAKSDVVVT